jgi:hypothetical protein
MIGSPKVIASSDMFCIIKYFVSGTKLMISFSFDHFLIY